MSNYVPVSLDLVRFLVKSRCDVRVVTEHGRGRVRHHRTPYRLRGLGARATYYCLWEHYETYRKLRQFSQQTEYEWWRDVWARSQLEPAKFILHPRVRREIVDAYQDKPQ